MKRILISLFALTIIGGSLAVVTSREPEAKAAPELSELTQINNERAKHGAPALVEDNKLNVAATQKAVDLVTRNYRWHHLPGESPWKYLAVYYPNHATGENLSWCHDTTTGRVRGWIGSPGHHRTMIDPQYTHWGTGSAYNSEDVCWYTVNYFVKP